MSTIEEIKAAITQLSLEERAELARWLHGWTDDPWDRQMAEDIAAGRLSKLLAEVDEDIDAGRFQDMP
jgi:hypothetical protein